MIALCRNGKKGVPKKARIQDAPVGSQLGAGGLFLAEAPKLVLQIRPDVWFATHTRWCPIVS